MPKVLLTTCGPHWPYAQQTPGGSAVWEDFEFLIDQTDVECDAWVAFDNPTRPVKASCILGNTMFISAEPPDIRNYGRDFLNQFRWVLTCHDIRHPGLIRAPQFQPWHVGVDCDNQFQTNLNYDSLCSLDWPRKTNLISAVISDKTTTAGHRQRLRFIQMLKECLGDDLHVFGRGHQPIGDKWKAVESYRFHLAMENTSLDHYITEKIGDAFLGYAFPFYAGAPNVGDYFPPKSFQAIDLSDPATAVEVVCGGIELGLDEERRSEIESARNVVLNETNLFPAIVKLLRQKMVTGPRQPIHVYPKSSHMKLAWSGVRRNVLRAA